MLESACYNHEETEQKENKANASVDSSWLSLPSSPGIKAINKSMLGIVLRQADRKSDDKDQYSNCDDHTDDDENQFLKQNTMKRVTTEPNLSFFLLQLGGF